MGKHSVTEEENAIRDILIGKATLDDQIRDVDDLAAGDDLDAFFAQFDLDETTKDAPEAALPQAPRQSLYADDLSFLDEALKAAFHDVPHASLEAGGVGWKVHTNHAVAELTPPLDLCQRLGQLPQNYLQYGKVLERLTLATSLEVGNAQLVAAREGKGVADDVARGALSRSTASGSGLGERPRVECIGPQPDLRGPRGRRFPYRVADGHLDEPAWPTDLASVLDSRVPEPEQPVVLRCKDSS